MKTRDLDSIWDEEDFLEPDPLGDVVGNVHAPAPTEEDAGGPGGAEPVTERPDEAIRERPKRKRRRGRVRPRRRRVGAWSRGARFWGVVVLALAVGTVAPQLIELSGGGDGDGDGAGSAPVQRVVTWQVVDEEGQPHLAVFAAGGKPAVAVAIPSEVTIVLPGQSLDTLGEASESGAGLVEVAVENLLGVPVDQTVLSEGDELAAAIDAAGGIDVLDERIGGATALDYLAEPGEDAPVDAVFLRWQDVLDGLLAEVERPEVASLMPDPIRPMLRAGPVDVTALPVIEIGGGLLRPDVDALERMVGERFVEAGADGVRLVVLNGVGTPGIGEDVARILVPEGFRLVSSGNARDFNFKETQIVASSREDLPAAERARALLGVGRLLFGNQPTGLADVTVVVGRDFGGS